MKKKILSMLTAALIILTAASVTSAFTCKVVSVQGEEVKIECKERYIKKYSLEQGSKVKVRAKKQRKALEGC